VNVEISCRLNPVQGQNSTRRHSIVLAAADEAVTDEVDPRYGELAEPVRFVWSTDDR
jgi:hypothetical protein